MVLYELKQVQRFPVPIQDAWNFFSHPNNLQTITPPDVKFIQLTKLPDEDEMHRGLIIKYKFAPFLGIFFEWEAEMSEIERLHYFVDEQKSGPFSVWKHRHVFKSIDGGTEMTDYLQYKPPFGFLGSIAHTLFLKKQIFKIFNFRYKKLEEIFGKMK